MNTHIYVSDSFDPWFNLSVEEYLYDSIAPDTVILYLWRNENTVVIGKSQNAWKECRVSVLEADGGKLARRTSGGGAVYHDLGNMCYTFIASSGLYDLERQLSVILNAVRSLGIDASYTGRNDICTSDGRKFSGNAFRFSGSKGLMHGTLLLNTDAGQMSRFLQVSKAKLTAKGVDSVRSRTVNLIELCPTITPTAVSDAMIASFSAVYNDDTAPVAIHISQDSSNSATAHGIAEDDGEREHFTNIYQRFSSWEWRLGETPVFDMELERKFPWGLINISIAARNGIITAVRASTDAMDADLGETLSSCLCGVKLDYDALCSSVTKACALLAASGVTLADMNETSHDICQLLRDML